MRKYKNAIGMFNNTMLIVLRISVLILLDPNNEKIKVARAIVFTMVAIIINSAPILKKASDFGLYN